MGAQWKSKHKADASAAKGKLFTKLAKEVMVAARNGADPAMNSKLRMAIEASRKASMPKETLERAIKKAQACLMVRLTTNTLCTKDLPRIRCQ